MFQQVLRHLLLKRKMEIYTTRRAYRASDVPARCAKNTHRTFIAVFSSVNCGRVTNTVAALARSIAVTQHLKYTGHANEYYWVRSVANPDMLTTGGEGRVE